MKTKCLPYVAIWSNVGLLEGHIKINPTNKTEHKAKHFQKMKIYPKLWPAKNIHNTLETSS